MDWDQWLWGLQFLRECSTSRYQRNLRQVVTLGLYSRACLQALRERTGIEYHKREEGILHFYTNRDVFHKAREPAQRMTELGCERRVIDPDEATRIEPALNGIRDRVQGATYTPGDESGDARLFTQRLAAMGAEAGVRFHYNTRIMGLETDRGRITGVRVNRDGAFDRVEGDAYVVALGSFSAPLLRPLGIRVPVYPARGYSLTVPVRDPDRAYTVSLIDDEYKLVYSRLGMTCGLPAWRKSAVTVRILTAPAAARFWRGPPPVFRMAGTGTGRSSGQVSGRRRLRVFPVSEARTGPISG